jgi:glc operon protein GlcG
MPDIVATHRLTDEGARKMLDAAVAKARELGKPAVIAIVDSGGALVAFLRMEGSRFLTSRPTIKKAVTAASHRLPTGFLKPEAELRMVLGMNNELTNLPGGLPIIVGGEVIGGIGIGGPPPDEDVAIAEAALAALGAGR